MKRFVFLAVILMIVVVSIGCQQSGLSEEEVRSIVREEVTRQLASLDKLTVSELRIKNDDGQVIAWLGVEDDEAVLSLHNPDGKRVVVLGSVGDDGQLILYNSEGASTIWLGTLAGPGNGGKLHICNTRGEPVAMLVSGDDVGFLRLYNSDMEEVAYLGTASTGDGYLSISDKYGQPIIVAP